MADSVTKINLNAIYAQLQGAIDTMNGATNAARMQYDPYKLLRMDTIWVNESPEAAYGKGTAVTAVSPMECEAVEILFRKKRPIFFSGGSTTELEIISSGVIPVAKDDLASYRKRFCTQTSDRNCVANRYFTITDTGIAFESAEIVEHDTEIQSLAFEPLIPLAIYGFRKPAEEEIELTQQNRYGDTPFTLISLPQNQTLPRYAKQADGSIAQIGTLDTFSPIRACPKYLGFRLEEDAVMYLYIGDMVDGVFVPDPAYTLAAYTNSSGDVLFNYLNSPDRSRIVETDGSKYFYYCIRKEGQGITIIGSDTWPESQTKNLALVPDSTHKSKEQHTKNGANYSIVLPEDCYFAVLVKDAPLDEEGNPTYDRSDFHAACVMESDATETGFAVTRICGGASFGYIPAGAGAALLTVPGACPPENVTVYTSKEVKIDSVGGHQKKARELARKMITDFSFTSQKSILWNDSSLPLTEGKCYRGVPYSSRWVNSHFVGFEVSAETALNALNDPYSVAYDGGKESIVTAEDGTVTAAWFDPVSGHSEISRNDTKPREGGGPGYGLVCSAFMSLIFGNPYPQSNQGFTFDSNFCITPMTAHPSGTIAVNKGLTHCVMVDELYDNGYAVLEATDPCVAQTVHTNEQPVSGALHGKTSLEFLDSYLYSVANLDDSGYGNELLSLDSVEIPNGVIRPWRGHKAVYGPWDKSGKGSGIGVTIHPSEDQVTAGTLQVVVVYEPDTVNEETALNETVLASAQYLDISAAVTKPGTYSVSCGDGNPELFRYYTHEPVTLTIEEDGRAVFSHPDVLYAYARVSGYGGTWGRQLGDKDGPMVIAAGKYYPDLADMSRITEVYAAIVKDPDSDCWGKYSCLCSKGGM